MTNKEFDVWLDGKLDDTKRVLSNKSCEYSTEASRFHNFERAALNTPNLNATRELAAFNMSLKHFVSIQDIIVDINEDNMPLSPLFVAEKFGDMINYLFLIWAMIDERFNYIDAPDDPADNISSETYESEKSDLETSNPKESGSKPQIHFDQKMIPDILDVIDNDWDSVTLYGTITDLSDTVGSTLVIKINDNEFYAVIKPDKSWFSVLPRSVFGDDTIIEARLIITDRDGNDTEPGLRSRVWFRSGRPVKRITKGE